MQLQSYPSSSFLLKGSILNFHRRPWLFASWCNPKRKFGTVKWLGHVLECTHHLACSQALSSWFQRLGTKLLTISLANSLSQFIILRSCLILSSCWRWARSERCVEVLVGFHERWGVGRRGGLKNEKRRRRRREERGRRREEKEEGGKRREEEEEREGRRRRQVAYTHLGSHHLNPLECYAQLTLHTLKVCPQLLHHLSLLLPGGGVHPCQPSQLTHRRTQIRETEEEYISHEIRFPTPYEHCTQHRQEDCGGPGPIQRVGAHTIDFTPSIKS